MSNLEILNKHNFKFNKAYGQNFIFDTNFLQSIVDKINVEGKTVLEIGPGAGALTRAIASKVKKVVSFEIDKTLEPILCENLKEFDNSQIIFKDFMKTSDDEILDAVGEDYIVIANLPYYITTPILFRFFEMKNKPKSLTIMVQKEYGERMVANENSSEYSSLSVLSRFLGEAKIVKKVGRQMFTPPPKVDSCIVHFKFNKNPYDEMFAKFIKTCFAMRRKTLVNNLSHGLSLDKSAITNILTNCGVNVTARAETLSTDKIFELYNYVKNNNLF